MLGFNKTKQPSIISAVLKASSALLKILQEENSALQKGSLDATQSIVERKIEAINNYSAVQDQFVVFSRQNQIDKESADVKKISEMMRQIQQENDKNERLLRVNIDISEKIITTYKDAQIKNAVNMRGYDRHGRANGAKENKEMMPAVSLNNKI